MTRFAMCVICITHLIARPLSSQSANEPRPSSTTLTRVFAANIGIGALIAAVGAVTSRHSVGRAAVRGTIGGAVAYSGKAIVGRNLASTVLLGREIAAVGASIVENAGRGKGVLDRVVLPYGPLRAYIFLKPRVSVRVKLDLISSVVAIKDFRDSQLAFDMRRSATTGTGVFLVDSAAPGVTLGGSHIGNVIEIRSVTPFINASSTTVRRIIGHELVHVSQFDFTFLTLAEPVESVIVPMVPGGKWIHTYVDLGINVPFWSVANSLIPYSKRPWEREAATFEGH